MRMISWLASIILLVTFVAGCGSTGNDTTMGSMASEGMVYPSYTDANNNAINDYYEAATHDPGSSSRAMGQGSATHAFVDEDNDGICDYAQNGSSTWHGPGFMDEDGDGMADYWDTDSPRYAEGGGMIFVDVNNDGLCDHVQEAYHNEPDHDFIDADGDGVCDYAQSGSGVGQHGMGGGSASGNGGTMGGDSTSGNGETMGGGGMDTTMRSAS